MKFDKIVGFGDSWMYGDELLDPALLSQHPEAHSCWSQNTGYRESHCFLGLLGKHYDVPVLNFGIPGGSFRSAIWTYLWWIQREPDPARCLILHALTESDRETFYNPDHVHYSNDPEWNKFVHSTWVHFGSSVVPAQWRNFIKQYIVLTESPELRIYNYLEAINFFHGQCCATGMPMLQFHTMPPPTDITVPSIVWPDFCYSIFFRDHPQNKNRELIMPDGHPNERGHEIIRDQLIPEIDRAILSQ